MMKAIGASKKKNDKIDARKTADLVRSAAGVLRSAGRDARAAAAAALPECGRSASGADEEQDERVADGGGGRIQQAATTWEEVLHGTAGQPGRGAGIGEGSAASEPGRAGDVRGDAAAIAQPAAKGNHSWSSGWRC
jgi:hypothetical protein